MNYTELLQQVQKELGKNGDTALITEARCGQWLNAGQMAIVMDIPGLWDCHRLDKTTWDATENQYEYDLDDFIVYPVCHPLKIKYINTTTDNYYWIRPYVGGLDAWDECYPYIPGRGTGYPTYYVRRGSNIELDLPFSADAAGADLWLEYCQKPYTMVSAAAIAASPGGAVRVSNVVTITTTAAHSFGVGDKVDVSVTTVVGSTSFDGEFVVASVPTSTTFTYAQTAGDDTGGAGTVNHLPLLTDFDEPLIAMGKAYGYGAMGRRFFDLSVRQREYALFLIGKRVAGESPVEQTEQNTYKGP